MAVDLAISLNRRGFRSSVIALDEGGVLEAPLREAGVEFVVMNGRRFKDPRRHMALAAELRRLGAGVVHTHMFAPLLHSLPALSLSGVKHLVHTEHSFEYLEPRASYRHTLRWMSRATRAFTLVGERMLPFYEKVVGVARHRLQVIVNGVDPEKYRPGQDKQKIRVELGIPVDALVVGSAGRLAPEKNYGMLIEAAAKCRARGTPIHIALFGEGTERLALMDSAAKIGIAEHVSFLGWRTDLPRVLPALDVFALTSHSEGLPLVLLEAMALGLPVVSTPVGDIPQLVREAHTGFLVAVGDTETLAARLSGPLVEATRREQMGSIARQAVIAEYSHEAMVGRYVTAYGF
jgi:glycosyltransferase involved in cell wall biosynthesis